MERSGVTSAGAELTLRFGGNGRLLPSRVRKVVPDATELTVCLRGCVEQLRVPPFGRGADDRLEVDVFVSIERDWAMLRTVPRLRLARR